MMKLVISFDEIGIDNGFTELEDDEMFYRLENFIADQFPDWNIFEAFDVKTLQWDFANTECHIDMRVI